MALLCGRFNKYHRINCFTMALLLPLERNIVTIKAIEYPFELYHSLEDNYRRRRCICVGVCSSVRVCIGDDAEIFEFDFVVCVDPGI